MDWWTGGPTYNSTKSSIRKQNKTDQHPTNNKANSIAHCISNARNNYTASKQDQPIQKSITLDPT